MRIVALHTDFRLYWPARLNALSSALQKREDSLEVIEIAGKGSNYHFADNAENKVLSWHILFPDSNPEDLSGDEIQLPLFRLLDEIQPDVIIAGAIAFPSGALAVRYGQKKGCRVIVFDDAKIENVKRNPIVNFIKHAVYNGVDALLYPASEWNPTGKFWGFQERQMFYGVDVVDNDFWSRPRNSSNQYGDYFIVVGRQIPEKNFSCILNAYKQYHDTIGTNDSFNLLLVGDGPEHRSLLSLVQENGLDEKVKFLPFKSQEELSALYQNAAALVISSKSETWGLVINEAMACSCAIFSSLECGATSSLVFEGINGYRYKCNEMEVLANCMLEFHNLGKEKQREMGYQSYKRIQEWGLSRFVIGTLDAIDYVVTHPKRTTSVIDKLIISKWNGRYCPI